MGDVKCYLRKMDFPSVVPEAIRHIQKLLLPDCSSPQIGLMNDLCEEFVFFEKDKWGNKGQKLSPIKELQIVERIAWYFRQPENDQKMATFQFLFPKGSLLLDYRMPVLAKLVSLAIATENGNVLNMTGTWMQLCLCASDHSISIAKLVVLEHIKTKPSDRMKNLPKISPVFCASLMAAITNMFTTNCPPAHMINLFLDWLSNAPSMCYSPFRLVVPKIINFSGPQTPLPGLIFWCVIAPLYKESRNGAATNYNYRDGNITTEYMLKKLLVAVLQCMKKCNPREWAVFEAVSTSHFLLIAKAVKELQEIISRDHLDKALDRFTMCFDVALTSGCLQVHPTMLGSFFHDCLGLNLPYNRPLKIVFMRWTSLVNPLP